MRPSQARGHRMRRPQPGAWRRSTSPLYLAPAHASGSHLTPGSSAGRTARRSARYSSRSLESSLIPTGGRVSPGSASSGPADERLAAESTRPRPRRVRKRAQPAPAPASPRGRPGRARGRRAGSRADRASRRRLARATRSVRTTTVRSPSCPARTSVAVVGFGTTRSPRAYWTSARAGSSLGKRRPPEVAARTATGSARRPSHSTRARYSWIARAPGGGRHHRSVAAERKILPEVAGQIQERRRSGARAPPCTRGRKTGREPRDLGRSGPPGTTRAPTRTCGLDREEDGAVDPAEGVARVGDGPLPRVRDAVAVDVEPVPDRAHERHQVDHLLAQPVPQPERRRTVRPGSGARPSVDSMRPVGIQIDAAARHPDRSWCAHRSRLDEQLALRPARRGPPPRSPRSRSRGARARPAMRSALENISPPYPCPNTASGQPPAAARPAGVTTTKGTARSTAAARNGPRASAPRGSGARASGTRATSTTRPRRRRPRPATAPPAGAPRRGSRRAPRPRLAAAAFATGPIWRRKTTRDRVDRGNHARPPPSGAVMSAGAGGRRSRASRACSRNAETLPVVKTEATTTRSGRMPRRSSARRRGPKAARCSGARGGPRSTGVSAAKPADGSTGRPAASRSSRVTTSP